eukprot:scaffold32403_cov73-Phaeocystis_antarctica.AAC.6
MPLSLASLSTRVRMTRAASACRSRMVAAALTTTIGDCWREAGSGTVPRWRLESFRAPIELCQDRCAASRAAFSLFCR